MLWSLAYSCVDMEGFRMESHAQIFIAHGKTIDVLQDVITSNYTYIKIVCMTVYDPF